MSAHIIDGKALAQKIKNEIQNEVLLIKSKGTTPCLAVIIVGNDQASRVYVNNKKKACADVGMESREITCPEDIKEEDLMTIIDNLNNDSNVHGILVQLPLPKHISEEKIINYINPKKDVDCFHPFNVGKLMTGSPIFEPCTPAGIIALIKESGCNISGAECVVVGRSNIVGKPVAMMLLAENGTVTIAHSKSKNLKEICKKADILVVAIGKAKFVNSDYIKNGATVIDVGMDRDEYGKLCGDVDFDSAKEIAGAITPVPGGVGPMTITMLIKNTLKAANTFLP